MRRNLSPRRQHTHTHTHTQRHGETRPRPRTRVGRARFQFLIGRDTTNSCWPEDESVSQLKIGHANCVGPHTHTATAAGFIHRPLKTRTNLQGRAIDSSMAALAVANRSSSRPSGTGQQRERIRNRRRADPSPSVRIRRPSRRTRARIFFFRFRSPPMNYASTGSAQTTPHADRAAQPLEPTATDATAATTPRKSMFVPPSPPPHLVGVCVCSSRCITKLDASLSDLSNKTQQNATANGCQQPPAPPRPTFSFSRSYDSVTSPVEAGRRKKETRKRCKYCDYETVSETGRLE